MAKSKSEAIRPQRTNSRSRPRPTVNKRRATAKPTTGAPVLPGPATKPSARSGAAGPNDAASGTKQSRVLMLLRSSTGATITSMMQATGWQQHSVRGFLAGVVRKRLGLKLTSNKVDGTRVYQIAGSGRGVTSVPQPKARLAA